MWTFVFCSLMVRVRRPPETTPLGKKTTKNLCHPLLESLLRTIFCRPHYYSFRIDPCPSPEEKTSFPKISRYTRNRICVLGTSKFQVRAHHHSETQVWVKSLVVPKPSALKKTTTNLADSCSWKVVEFDPAWCIQILTSSRWEEMAQTITRDNSPHADSK